MTNEVADVAILLVYAAERAIRKRKITEALVGYPSDYGDDAFILVKMQQFLHYKDVKGRLVELLKNKS